MSFHRSFDLSEQLQALSAENIKFHPSTGISILVVGAGVGGLMTALECRRKGHQVRVIERAPGPSSAGDLFSIGGHIIRHFYNNWPDMAAMCERINNEAYVSYHKITGEQISPPEPPPHGDLQVTLADGTEKHIPFNRHNRPKFVAMLLAQAQKLGVDVSFKKRVVEYFEEAETQNGGVLLEDGTRLTADLVVAADGIGTKSTKLITGHDTRAYPSGFSMFRTAYPIELAISDPDIESRWPLLDGGRPHVELWIGDGLSFGVQRYTDIMSWHLMHKTENGTGMESWSQTVDNSKALEITAQIPGFPEIANRLIKTTPKDGLVDWDLMWRDPRETWTSPHGRVVQLGDSAHTFLPSSGSGANQAMEDAITLATCLQVAGKSNISWATKVYNKLRFERTSCLQLSGFINHQRTLNANFDAVGADGKPFKITIGQWAASHDPEKYAYDNYDNVLSHLLSGTPFQNSNLPPGYTYKPWSIQGMFDKINARETLHFDGDWS